MALTVLKAGPDQSTGKTLVLTVSISYTPTFPEKQYQLLLFTNDRINPKGRQSVNFLSPAPSITDSKPLEQTLQVRWNLTKDDEIARSAAIMCTTMVMITNADGSRGWQRFGNGRLPLKHLLEQKIGSPHSLQLICYDLEQHMQTRGLFVLTVKSVEGGVKPEQIKWKQHDWEIFDESLDDLVKWSMPIIDRSAFIYEHTQAIHSFIVQLHSYYFHLGLYPMMAGAFNVLYEPSRLPSETFFLSACNYVCDRWQIPTATFLKWATKPAAEKEYLAAQQITAETVLSFAIMSAYVDDLMLDERGQPLTTDTWFPVTLSLTGDCEDKARMIVILSDQLCRLSSSHATIAVLQQMCRRFMPCHLLCAARAPKVGVELSPVTQLTDEDLTGHYTSIWMPCSVFLERWKFADQAEIESTSPKADIEFYRNKLENYVKRDPGPFPEHTLVLEGTGYSRTLHSGNRDACQSQTTIPDSVRRKTLIRAAMNALDVSNETFTALYEEMENGLFFDGISVSVFTPFFQQFADQKEVGGIPFEFGFFKHNSDTGLRYGVPTFDLFAHNFKDVGIWPTFMLTHNDIENARVLLLEEPPMPPADSSPNSWNTIGPSLLPSPLIVGKTSAALASEDMYISVDQLNQTPNILQNVLPELMKWAVIVGYDLQPQQLGMFARVRIRFFMDSLDKIMKLPFIAEQCDKTVAKLRLDTTATQANAAQKDAFTPKKFRVWLEKLQLCCDKHLPWRCFFKALIQVSNDRSKAAQPSMDPFKRVLSYPAKDLPIWAVLKNPPSFIDTVQIVLFSASYLNLSSKLVSCTVINKEREICAVNLVSGYPSLSLRSKFHKIWNVVFGRSAQVQIVKGDNTLAVMSQRKCIIGTLGMEPFACVDKRFVSLVGLETKACDFEAPAVWAWLSKELHLRSYSSSPAFSSRQLEPADQTPLRQALKLNANKPAVVIWLKQQLQQSPQVSRITSDLQMFFDHILSLEPHTFAAQPRWRSWNAVEFRARVAKSWAQISSRFADCYTLTHTGTVFDGGVCICTVPRSVNVPVAVTQKLQLMWDRIFPGCYNLIESGAIKVARITGNLGCRLRVFVGKDEVQLTEQPLCIATIQHSRVRDTPQLYLMQQALASKEITQAIDYIKSPEIRALFSVDLKSAPNSLGSVSSDQLKLHELVRSTPLPETRVEKTKPREIVEHVLFERLKLNRRHVSIQEKGDQIVIDCVPLSAIPEDVRQRLGRHLAQYPQLRLIHEYDLDTNKYKPAQVTGSLVSGFPWICRSQGEPVVCAALRPKPIGTERFCRYTAMKPGKRGVEEDPASIKFQKKRAKRTKGDKEDDSQELSPRTHSPISTALEDDWDDAFMEGKLDEIADKLMNPSASDKDEKKADRDKPAAASSDDDDDRDREMRAILDQLMDTDSDKDERKNKKDGKDEKQDDDGPPPLERGDAPIGQAYPPENESNLPLQEVPLEEEQFNLPPDPFDDFNDDAALEPQLQPNSAEAETQSPKGEEVKSKALVPVPVPAHVKSEGDVLKMEQDDDDKEEKPSLRDAFSTKPSMSESDQHVLNDWISRGVTLVGQIEGKSKSIMSNEPASFRRAAQKLVEHLKSATTPLIKISVANENSFVFYSMLSGVIVPAMRTALKRLITECKADRQSPEAISEACERLEVLAEQFAVYDRLHLQDTKRTVYRIFGIFETDHNPQYMMLRRDIQEKFESLQKRSRGIVVVSSGQLSADLKELLALDDLVEAKDGRSLHVFTSWKAGPETPGEGPLRQLREELLKGALRGKMGFALEDVRALMPKAQPDDLGNPRFFRPVLPFSLPYVYVSRLEQAATNASVLRRIPVADSATFMQNVHEGFQLLHVRQGRAEDLKTATRLVLALQHPSIEKALSDSAEAFEIYRTWSRTYHKRFTEAFKAAAAAIRNIAQVSPIEVIRMSAHEIKKTNKEISAALSSFRTLAKPGDPLQPEFKADKDANFLWNLRGVMYSGVTSLNLFLQLKFKQFLTSEFARDFYHAEGGSGGASPKSNIFKACKLALSLLLRIEMTARQVIVWEPAVKDPDAFFRRYKLAEKAGGGGKPVDQKEVKTLLNGAVDDLVFAYGMVRYALQTILDGFFDMDQLGKAVVFWQDACKAVVALFAVYFAKPLIPYSSDTWFADVHTFFVFADRDLGSDRKRLFSKYQAAMKKAPLWTNLAGNLPLLTLARVPSLGARWNTYWRQGGSAELKQPCKAPRGPSLSVIGALCKYVFEDLFSLPGLSIVERPDVPPIPGGDKALLPAPVCMYFKRGATDEPNFSASIRQWTALVLDHMFPCCRQFTLDDVYVDSNGEDYSVLLFSSEGVSVPAGHAIISPPVFNLAKAMETWEKTQATLNETSPELSLEECAFDVLPHTNSVLMLRAMTNLSGMLDRGYSHPFLRFLADKAAKQLTFNGAFVY